METTQKLYSAVSAVKYTDSSADRPAPNAYSAHWFQFFHVGIGDARTMQEVEFICRCAPLPQFRDVVDICCGMGRHSRALAAAGYSVTGIDRDAGAIAKARELEGGVTYVQMDVRDYRPRANSFDLAIIMSQSFGSFDASTNEVVLGQIAGGLRRGGRIILDLWNPEFFRTHQGRRNLETDGGRRRRDSFRSYDETLVVRCSVISTTALSNTELYQLAYESAWQGPFCWKANRALARVVVLELFLHLLHY